MRKQYLFIVLFISGTALAARSIGVLGQAPALETELRTAGYNLSHLEYKDFVQNNIKASQYDCIIFPQSRRFPYAGRSCLFDYLKQGGNIVTMGGFAFKDAVFEDAGRWYTSNELLDSLLKKTAEKTISLKPVDVNTADWTRDCDNQKNPSTIKMVDEQGTKCLKIEICNFTRWDTFGGPFSSGNAHNALVLDIKGSTGLKDVVVEIREKDGSRWYKNIRIGPDWSQAVAFENEFTFIIDGSPASRGKPGDKLNLPNANFIRFGLVLDISPKPSGNYSIYIKNGSTAKIDLPQGFGSDLFDQCLPIFYDRSFHHFTADSVRLYRQDIVENIPQQTMPLHGLSALGFGYADESKYVPLIEALDQHGRRAGLAGGVLVHYDGQFRNGNWIIFGVETPEFYKSEIFIKTVVSALNKLSDNSCARALEQHNAQAKKIFAPRPRSARPRLKLSTDKKHIVDANGSKFFMLGINYIGSFDCVCSHASTHFMYEKWEADFAKAQAAGVNCIRLWIEGLDGRKELMDTILYLADKYDIYLLLHPMAHSLENSEDSAAVFSQLAQLVHDEPMIIGYDLMNEPYVTMIGSVKIGGKESPICQYNAYIKHKGQDYYNKLWVDTIATSRTGWPELPAWANTDEAYSLYAAHDIANRYAARFISATNYSSLAGIEGKLPVDKDYSDFFDALEKTFAQWIQVHKSAIRKYDSRGLVTVGYNCALQSLNANLSLDFVNHHLYQRPMSYEDMQIATTTYDRLRKMWPDKPVTLGEFGYSYGLRLLNGEYLDIGAAGMAEMMIYLYAFANDYDGALSWMLSDWPVPLLDHSAPWISKSDQDYQAGFGIYLYDGTLTGKPKPIVHAMKFLSRYMKTKQAGTGTFKLIRTSTPIGCGYVYESNDAFFVGASTFSSSDLSLQSAQSTNCMLTWSGSKINIVTSTDADLKISKAFLKRVLKADYFKIAGNTRSVSPSGSDLSISTLEGEQLIISGINK